jgi:methionine-rich copper-binding protein CopC
MTAHTRPPQSLGRALAAAAAALLIAAGGLLIASPASAHDELISTDPVADAALDALPAQLTLTFSGDIATDPGASEVQVTDAAGTQLAEGEPQVEGTVVTQPLAGAASGAVTVLWKVVSSDGHPISGEFGFTVPTAAPPTPTDTPTPSATPSESASEEPTATPTETADPVEPTSDDASALPWILLGVLAVAVLGAIVYLLVSRSRREKALAEGGAAGRRIEPEAAAQDPDGGSHDGAAGGSASGSAPESGPPADR